MAMIISYIKIEILLDELIDELRVYTTAKKTKITINLIDNGISSTLDITAMLPRLSLLEFEVQFMLPQHD